MATHSKCYSFYRFLVSLGKILQPIILLAMRLFWGYLFFIAGSGKLLNAGETAQQFSSLGIPLPVLFAYLVGFLEAAGGILLVIGLGSRLAAIPLLTIMVVAYLTAHGSVFHHLGSDPEAFVKQAPFNYLLTTLIILAFGPGIISLDALIKRIWYRNGEVVVSEEEHK